MNRRFAVLLFVTLANVLWCFASGVLVLRIEDDIYNLNVESKHVESIFTAMLDAETGQRGFLLTGDANYLQPYNDARFRAAGEMKWLATSSLPPTELEAIRHLCADKMSELEQTVKYKESNLDAAALEVVKTNRGRMLMDDIRMQLDVAQKRTNVAIADSMRNLNRITISRTVSFAIVSLQYLLMLRWASEAAPSNSKGAA